MRAFAIVLLVMFATPAWPCSLAEDEDQAPEAWQAPPSHLAAINEARLWLVKFGKRRGMKSEGKSQLYDVEVVETLRGAAPAKKKIELVVDMAHPCGDEESTTIPVGQVRVVALTGGTTLRGLTGEAVTREDWFVDDKDEKISAWLTRLRFLIAKITDDASYTKKLRATDAAMKAKDYEKVVKALQAFAGKGMLDARRLDRLGLALGKLGRHAEAVAELEDARMHTRLVFKDELPLDPELFFRIRFNLLCYLSLAGQHDSSEARWVLDAFVTLLKAEKKPRRERWIKALKTDPDLANLRKTKEFAEALKAK